MKIVLLTVLFSLSPIGGEPKEIIGHAEQVGSMELCQVMQQVRASYLADKYKRADYKGLYFTVACLAVGKDKK